MSFQNQSGELMPFTEVVPASAQFGALERSSILTQRRRCRLTPQTGPTSAAGNQVTFLVSDQGGMLDLRSAVLNYNITTTGASSTPVPDDGHPFITAQATLNGQLLENITNAPKVTNVELCMGGSQSYYRTAGSLQGFELLNEELIPTLPAAASVDSAWGCVAQNAPSINVRYSRASTPQNGNLTGAQRSIPLGLMFGLGRMKQLLPISIVGELGLVLQVGQIADVLFTTTSATDAGFTLTDISLEYDIVVPNERYFSLLQKIAMDDPAGLVMPYESAVVSTGGTIASSASSLSESTIIVSRATNNLTRAALVQVQASQVSALGFPSQSCFSKAATNSVQFRAGSLVFPQVACRGDAALFNMSMAAYGSVVQENGWVGNRALWANSTNGTTAGTAAVYETDQVATGGSVKFAYADKFIPSYGFQVVKGAAEPMAVDGISIAGASGSQLICSILSAPQTSYVPFVITTALRFIVARAGSVVVQGA